MLNKIQHILYPWTCLFFNNILAMLGEKKEINKIRVVGTTLALLKNKFYRFPSTGLTYCITTDNNTEREERKHMPIFSLILFYAHIIPCFQSLTAFVFLKHVFT